jgi:hypothetical protein
VRRNIEKKLWSIFVSVAVGMSLLFMFASSYPLKTRALSGLAMLGFVLLQMSLRRRVARRNIHLEVLIDEATIVIDGQGCGEIFLGAKVAFLNPRLTLTTLGGRTVVEDLWHDSLSVLAFPMTTLHWRLGVVYPGELSVQSPLKMLIRNDSNRPATVRARVYAKRS